ncbi:MAG: YraN family protein [Candidatus Omnitrophota bacterium]
MPEDKISFGKNSEALAAAFLKKQGYRIIVLNYRTKLGEIDIIAQDKDTLCFIEVKARRTDRFGLPQDAVSRRKQGQISKAALIFLKEKKLLERKARFDVVALLGSDNAVKFDLIKNAFELSGQYAC